MAAARVVVFGRSIVNYAVSGETSRGKLDAEIWLPKIDDQSWLSRTSSPVTQHAMHMYSSRS